MIEQLWKRIISDYGDRSFFSNKKEILSLFSSVSDGDFSSYDDITQALLNLIEETMITYEENIKTNRKVDYWSLHIQSITMLETVFLLKAIQ